MVDASVKDRAFLTLVPWASEDDQAAAECKWVWGHRSFVCNPPPPLISEVSVALLKLCSVCVCARVHACARAHLLSCPTLCNSTNCSPPGSSVHGILQTRILEWVSSSSSRESPNPQIQHISCISCIGRQNLYQMSQWRSPYKTQSFSGIKHLPLSLKNAWIPYILLLKGIITIVCRAILSESQAMFLDQSSKNTGFKCDV